MRCKYYYGAYWYWSRYTCIPVTIPKINQLRLASDDLPLLFSGDKSCQEVMCLVYVVTDIQGGRAVRRYLANKSVTELLQLYSNDTAAARRAVLRQLRLVNNSLAQLDAMAPHPTVDDFYQAAARSDVPTGATRQFRSSRLRPPTPGGWLPPLLHRHRRWTGNCIDETKMKLMAWIAEPGKQVELPCVTW